MPNVNKLPNWKTNYYNNCGLVEGFLARFMIIYNFMNLLLSFKLCAIKLNQNIHYSLFNIIIVIIIIARDFDCVCTHLNLRVL